MARLQQDDYTYLSEREIAGTGIGTSPAAVAFYQDIQRAIYQDQPADTAEAQAAAAAADTKAAGAQTAADAAQGAADSASSRADAAQDRADAAYGLADGKVSKNATPEWSAPTGQLARTSVAVYTAPTAASAYDPAQMQALMDSHQAWTRRMAALVTDLIAIGALKD